ncbi:hypothetical protein [Guptibacillus hwajinpoensis]|uniref:hypothetical protein n=1 Tax=Guptibacillus hwajinpoensis TaxID=208199 RepID=UPI003D002AEE
MKIPIDKIPINRYQKTYISWVSHKISEEIVKKRAVVLFFIVAMLAFIIYHLSIPFNQSKIPIELSGVFVDFFNIKHVHDDIIKNIITTVVSSLTIIISLLSAVYVFTHREQKNVSPSASTDNRKNKLLILVICLMVFNLIFGSLIVREFNGFISEDDYVTSLEATKQLFSRILLLGLSLIILISVIEKFIKFLFKTMSVDSMLIDSVKHTSKKLNSLINTDRSTDKFEGFLSERYKKFHYSLESVFQNLMFAADNNMNKEFEENIDNFKNVIKVLKDGDEELNIINVSHYLFNEDGARFINAYNSALRSNLSLISHLMKNHQYTKAKKAVSLYFYMYLDSDEKLQKIFKISLFAILDFIDTDDERQLLILLEGLDEIPKDQTIIMYKFLLLKLINKNSMINLTNLVYTSKKYTENALLGRSMLMILLQVLIKSIEISSYEITGFIVKFLITNFSGKKINKALIVLNTKVNKNAYSSVLETGEKIEGINENGIYALKINEETFDYCFKKAYILLYAQHIFSIKNGMWYMQHGHRKESGNEIMLSKQFINCPYSKYIITKLTHASNNYGLLFFKDESVMKKIYKEINVEYTDSKKQTDERDLPETINLLISKLFKL